jgi:hypothetical protein
VPNKYVLFYFNWLYQFSKSLLRFLNLKIKTRKSYFSGFVLFYSSGMEDRGYSWKTAISFRVLQLLGSAWLNTAALWERAGLLSTTFNYPR